MVKTSSLPFTGILQAIFLTLSYAIFNVYLRTAVQLFDVHPIVFTNLCLIACSFMVMLAAGPGRLAKETMTSPATWAYGIIVMGPYFADLYLMQYMSGTEASLFSRLTVPFSLAAAWLLMRRRPDKGDWYGLALIILGLTVLVLIQPRDLFFALLVVGFAVGAMQTIEFLITETHRESNIAHEQGNLRDKARVIGFVTFSTSLVFMISIMLLSTLNYVTTLPATLANNLPQLHHFTHPATIISAIIFGITVLPISRYCKWSSTYNIKSENVFVFLAFVPILTFGIEWLLSFSPTFAFNNQAFSGERGFSVLMITIIMSVGASITALYKLRASLRESASLKEVGKALRRGEDRALASGYQPTAKDDYEAVTATLEQCGGDEALAARLLDVPVGALQAVLIAEGRQAFHPTVAARVARNFRHNVALADPLTGLQNRLNFMNALRPLLKTKKPLALLFIDLNKFKPVNDTYGHEAGDAVLKTISQRLLHTAPQGSLVARLGGDEFVITLSGNHIKQAPQITQAIRAAIQEPILLTSDLPPVELDAAIGKALYPNDAKTAEDLIKHADKQMYKVKRAR